LREVRFEESFLDDDYYDDDDDDKDDGHTTIQLYCVRNKTVPQLIANPDAVPAYLWTNILVSELNYEHKHDALFRSLMALGDKVG
jgi:hypothetical protein